VKPWAEIAAHVQRVIAHGRDKDGAGGYYMVASCVNGEMLGVIASDGLGWDHVSVSGRDRIPSWTEMEQVKRLFFRDNETAFQLHVPPVDHISCCEFCLHLWRPQRGAIPRPPAILVAPPTAEAAP
jgi:hypothetical protein